MLPLSLQAHCLHHVPNLNTIMERNISAAQWHHNWTAQCAGFVSIKVALEVSGSLSET